MKPGGANGWIATGMRAAPAASASVAAQLDIGTAARLVARQGTWCKVDIDGDGHPDFVVHESVDVETELDVLGRLVHANVAGQWVRMARDAGAAPCYD